MKLISSKFYIFFVIFRVGNSLIGFLSEKISKWAICSKKQAIRSFTHFWFAKYLHPTGCESPAFPSPLVRKQYGYLDARWLKLVWLSGCQVEGNSMAIQLRCERKQYEYLDAWWKETVWLSKCFVKGNSMNIRMPGERKRYDYPDARWKETVWLCVSRKSTDAVAST